MTLADLGVPDENADAQADRHPDHRGASEARLARRQGCHIQGARHAAAQNLSIVSSVPRFCQPSVTLHGQRGRAQHRQHERGPRRTGKCQSGVNTIDRGHTVCRSEQKKASEQDHEEKKRGDHQPERRADEQELLERQTPGGRHFRWHGRSVAHGARIAPGTRGCREKARPPPHKGVSRSQAVVSTDPPGGAAPLPASFFATVTMAGRSRRSAMV